jgi:hypothetical protein
LGFIVTSNTRFTPGQLEVFKAAAIRFENRNKGHSGRPLIRELIRFVYQETGRVYTADAYRSIIAEAGIERKPGNQTLLSEIRAFEDQQAHNPFKALPYPAQIPEDVSRIFTNALNDIFQSAASLAHDSLERQRQELQIKERESEEAILAAEQKILAAETRLEFEQERVSRLEQELSAANAKVMNSYVEKGSVIVERDNATAQLIARDNTIAKRDKEIVKLRKEADALRRQVKCLEASNAKSQFELASLMESHAKLLEQKERSEKRFVKMAVPTRQNLRQGRIKSFKIGGVKE